MGRAMPDISTPEGRAAYEEWAEWAFKNLGDRKRCEG